MKKQNYVIIALTSLILSGCDQAEPTHDVQYYLDHSDEREKKVEQCKNNLGELMKTLNCQSAVQAQDQVFDLNNKGGTPRIR